uniref:hypothetical protein n=1 Tax=Acetatifactor sp. TaxID=1872090 RepID=UPI004056478A
MENERADGIATGRAEERATVIIETLEELGEVPGNLKNIVLAQKDLPLLKEWHKKAAHVNTIEEFENFCSDFFNKD